MLSRVIDNLLHGQGSTTLLVGEAGIGKTPIAEFGASAARRAGVWTLVGRALPEQATSLLRPVAEALVELTRDCPPPLRSSAG